MPSDNGVMDVGSRAAQGSLDHLKSHLSRAATEFCQQARVDVPLICGAMYPCSNPELVAAASAAGALGMVQPIALSFVHGYEFRAGLRYIKSLTDRPIGVNIIVEKSSRVYMNRARRWVEIALEEGVRFFVTALGNPRWVVDAVHAAGGLVYHDVTNKRWAEIALSHGVDGLICVNRRAGGHAGTLSSAELLSELQAFRVPLVCAGGIGDETGFVTALQQGFAAVQMGTRFIATKECSAHSDYKQAIVGARGSDVILTERISGVPMAVIDTPYVQRVGTKAGPIARYLLRNSRTRHYMRMFYSLRGIWQLKHASRRGAAYDGLYQAGESVEVIVAIEPARAIIERCVRALSAAHGFARVGSS